MFKIDTYLPAVSGWGIIEINVITGRRLLYDILSFHVVLYQVKQRFVQGEFSA